MGPSSTGEGGRVGAQLHGGEVGELGTSSTGEGETPREGPLACGHGSRNPGMPGHRAAHTPRCSHTPSVAQGGAILAIRRDFGTSTAAEEAVVAAAKAGAVAGAFFGGALMLQYGRRRALAAGSAFFLAGPLLMALAPGLALLVLGRVLVGVGIGASAVVVPAYLGELAPAARRGATVEVYELLLTVGALAAVLVDAALAGLPHDWRWMVGAPLIPALALTGPHRRRHALAMGSPSSTLPRGSSRALGRGAVRDLRMRGRAPARTAPDCPHTQRARSSFRSPRDGWSCRGSWTPRWP